ncbi:hypothetical protein BPUTEOMOX_2812 [methanotrophic endosymbiont of Bathymodiolus puteoserpentis (Logatchev)]|nr:hypothetical protein BPUTEOMOX_2812 [methanotrophic endosymbiont of Bathymodiolus puteoserpentis (Logatchev)]
MAANLRWYTAVMIVNCISTFSKLKNGKLNPDFSLYVLFTRKSAY